MGAYAGLRVVDASQGHAGPMAAMMLADFGAEVIKVEPPGGDRIARTPGYLMWNRGKARVTLDLERPADLAALKALIAAADVAVFDHAPGRLEALGLDGAALTSLHPRCLLYTSPSPRDGLLSRMPSSA